MLIVIEKFIPIILLICLGYLIRSKNIIREHTMKDLRKLTIDYFLAALLIKTFARMQLEESTSLIVALIVVLYIIVFALTILLVRINFLKINISQFSTTGSAVYLIGIPLFGTLFGMDHLDYLLILGIGQELFFWPLLVPLLKLNVTGDKINLRNLSSFIKNNIIIAIIAGLFLNISGLMSLTDSSFIFSGIFSAVELLSTLSIPMSLIIVGYGLKVDYRLLKSSVHLLFIRYALLFTLGGVYYFTIIKNLITVNELFLYSYAAFLALPIPLALPVLVGSYGNEDDETITNNLAVLGILFYLLFTAIFILIRYS